MTLMFQGHPAGCSNGRSRVGACCVRALCVTQSWRNRVWGMIGIGVKSCHGVHRPRAANSSEPGFSGTGNRSISREYRPNRRTCSRASGLGQATCRCVTGYPSATGVLGTSVRSTTLRSMITLATGFMYLFRLFRIGCCHVSLSYPSIGPSVVFPLPINPGRSPKEGGTTAEGGARDGNVQERAPRPTTLDQVERTCLTASGGPIGMPARTRRAGKARPKVTELPPKLPNQMQDELPGRQTVSSGPAEKKSAVDGAQSVVDLYEYGMYSTVYWKFECHDVLRSGAICLRSAAITDLNHATPGE